MDGDRFVESFCHIVEGEGCDACGDHGFHFDAGASIEGYGGTSNKEVVVEGCYGDIYGFWGDSVTKRDEFGSFFCGLDSGDSCGGKSLTFGPTLEDLLANAWFHGNGSFGNGGA